MGILQEIPTANQFTQILQAVIGDSAAGTGISTVVSLLQQLDAPSLVSRASIRLEDMVSAHIQVNISGLAEARTQFQNSLSAFPADPTSLIAPMIAQLEQLKALAQTSLTEYPQAAIEGFKEFSQLIPSNARDLVADAANRLAELKGEFISGAFNDLRSWSMQIEVLQAELEPILAEQGGEGTSQERLLGYLRQKLNSLYTTLLDTAGGLPLLTAELEAAVNLPQVAQLQSIKAALILQLEQARVMFDTGNLTNLSAFQAAQASFSSLLETLKEIVAFMRGVIDGFGSGASRLLSDQYDYLTSLEIVDLGNLRERFTDAVAQVEAKLKDFDLESVQKTIDDVFQQLDEVLERFALPDLLDQFTAFEAQRRGISDTLNTTMFEAVFSIRKMFETVRNSLDNIMSALGTTDSGGQFHFKVERQLSEFLDSLRTTIDGIRPTLEGLRTEVLNILQQVQAALESVQGEIDGVKVQLQEALRGALTQLNSVNPKGTIDRINSQLGTTLVSLDEVDFDPVVDSVIGQINDMRDSLASIDPSSLNAFTIGTLKVSVAVLTDLKFSTAITDALMDEINKIIQIPKDAIAQIEAQVEQAFEQFNTLAPDELLKPLDTLFQPVHEALDALDVDALLKPLDRWHKGMLARLEGISPEALLMPIIDLHAELKAAVEKSSTTLIPSLNGVVDDLKTMLQEINLDSFAAELTRLSAEMSAPLEALSPDALLNPLVKAFDKVMAALDNFDPADLLQPLKTLFQAVTEPLEAMLAEHADQLSEIVAPLRALIDLLDPHTLFQKTSSGFAALRDLLETLKIGQLIADLMAPHLAMQASFEAHGGDADITLSASVKAMNPLSNDILGQTLASFRDFETRLQSLAQGEAPSALTSRYNGEIKPLLEKILPPFVREDVTPSTIRRYFSLVNPVELDTQIDQLYDAAKQKLRVVDPSQIQEKLRARYQKLTERLTALKPDVVIKHMEAMLGDLVTGLDALNFDLISSEIASSRKMIEDLIDVLDPQPIIYQLDGMAQSLLQLASELKPADILTELKVPFDAAKTVVLAFDPASFKAPLNEIFDRINALLEQINLGEVLQKLVTRLDKLSDELESGLRRTETAFNKLLAAIPV